MKTLTKLLGCLSSIEWPLIHKSHPLASRFLLRCAITLLLPLLFLQGCSPQQSTNFYYLNPNRNLSAIGRVALLEFNNNSRYPKVSDDVMQALHRAIQKKQIFGLVQVAASDPAWRSIRLETDAKYSLEQLAAMRRSLDCNAALVGTITEYQPYPQLTLGLRVRLIDLNDGELLWAAEQIWDTADKTTEARINHYFYKQMRSGYDPLRQELIIVSSLKFIKFVAYELAETLKPKS